MSFHGLQNFSCVSVYLASSYCLLMVQNTNLLRKIMSEPMQFLFYINIIFLSTTYIWTCLDYTSLYPSRNRLCKIGGGYVAFGLGQFRVRVANHSATLNLFFWSVITALSALCIPIRLYKKRGLIVGLCQFPCLWLPVFQESSRQVFLAPSICCCFFFKGKSSRGRCICFFVVVVKYT